jgi:DNA-binding NarL/FixJ family response regulator
MRILLAEDDALHRSFLRASIERILASGHQLYEAADGLSAIALARKLKPDCVVLDLQMPNASGVDAAKLIWRDKPDTKILFWSNYADEAYVRGVAKIVPGRAVYGYVLKSASEERLRFAVRGVFIEDQCVIDREVRGVQSRAENRLEGLTDGEFEILIDLALGLTDKAIAARRKMSIRGAQSRLRQLYEKLGLDSHPSENASVINSRTRAIYLALSRGLLNINTLKREEMKRESWLARTGQ